MSLARAFTTRRAKVFGGGDLEGKPLRSPTVKGPMNVPIRSQISAPIELIHTTNMLSYNAPDIPREPRTAASASSLSLRSDGSSEGVATGASSPLTSPESLSFPAGHDAKPASSAEPNHLSAFFMVPAQFSTPARDAPSATKRSLHPNKSHEPLTGQAAAPRAGESRPLENPSYKAHPSRLSDHSSGTSSTKGIYSSPRSPSASTASTASSHHSVGRPRVPKPSPMATQHRELAAAAAAAAESPHPFGQELAQVTELAEEYAPATTDKMRPAVSKEEQEVARLGLRKFTARDYIFEVEGLSAVFFDQPENEMASAPQWI